MTDQPAVPCDFKPGDRVVIVREARTGWMHFMLECTVEKVGKRDIVLDNGERFNAARPIKRNGTWDTPTELLHVDSDLALRLRREVNVAKRRNAAGVQIDRAAKFLRDRNDADARLALQAAIDTLDGKR